MKRHIRLRGINGETEGRAWESSTSLRIGRLDTLEIFLDDGSVSRRHAEVRATQQGWRLRDLGSTNGTFLNGNRLSTGEWPLRSHDIVRCGNITMVVDTLRETPAKDTPNPDNLVEEGRVCSSWEQALTGLAFDRNSGPRPGDQLVALLRAGHHLGHIESEEELLDSILNDAVTALDAQRGAIVLAEGDNNVLRLRALATGGRSDLRDKVAARPGFSQNLAQRSFQCEESILHRSIEEDPELAVARSIAEGAMASVMSVLLRTPRKKLGVLHLDRGPLQTPFNLDDLHLADALAANVSAGIESMQLLKKQRELFIKTITILAQAIDMRDEYTGGHTQRVKTYSLMLARQMNVHEKDIELIELGTPLHDIGKIGIDDQILKKPGRLTPEEFNEMKKHTLKGAAILGTIPELHPIIPIVRSHHERWDGKGYPDGLAGEHINALARIVAVADAFDAMTSDRPYRRGLSAEVAFSEVEKQSGLQFDPECARAFLAISERVVQELQPKTTRMAATDLTALMIT